MAIDRKMDSGLRAQQELEKIEQQIARLRVASNQDEGTRQQIHQLHERVQALREQVSVAIERLAEDGTGAPSATPLHARLHRADFLLTGAKFTETADSPTIPPSFAAWPAFTDQEVVVIGQQKARDTKQKVYRNFGMPNPEGYRKALRVMKIAEKFGRPIFTFVDTDGAYPGLGAEERGQAEAIARNLREMARLKVPIIATITGEGGSGGALAIAVADRVLMMENCVYSVISPEGCASIMWRDASKKDLAAQAMKITATDLTELGCIDGIVPEPQGGAHSDHDAAAALLRETLVQSFRRDQKYAVGGIGRITI